MYKGGFLRVVKLGIFRTLEMSEVDAKHLLFYTVSGAAKQIGVWV